MRDFIPKILGALPMGRRAKSSIRRQEPHALLPAPVDGGAVADDWQYACAMAQRLAAPVFRAAHSRDFAASIPDQLLPEARKWRRKFVGLEVVGRLLCGLAPLLELQIRGGAETEVIPLDEVHHLIDITTDPASPHRLNFSHGNQPLVDAAMLAQAILRAPTALWSALPARVQDNLADALAQTRALQSYENNWLLFPAMIEATLASIGRPWDLAPIELGLNKHEEWYTGDGMYSDGPDFRWDYYNSFVIHPMMADVLAVMVERDAAWRKMQSKVLQRTDRYCQILERLISPDGSFPAIGRSMSYRCAAFQPLAMLGLHQSLPAQLPPGQVRAALMAVIRRTLDDPANFDAQGWLKVGLVGSQPDLGEAYISTGSQYICSTALLPLGLPRTAPFWRDPPLRWTQHRIWGGEHRVPIDKAVDGL